MEYHTMYIFKIESEKSDNSTSWRKTMFVAWYLFRILSVCGRTSLCGPVHSYVYLPKRSMDGSNSLGALPQLHFS